MEAEAGQVGRIGCLLVMILVLCAAGIETASGHRHHVSNSNNSHHQQGGTGKSRPLTKTDSSINQQDQGPTMTIKSLASSSGEYPHPKLIFSLKTDQISAKPQKPTPYNSAVITSRKLSKSIQYLFFFRDGREKSTKEEQMVTVDDVVGAIIFVIVDESSL